MKWRGSLGLELVGLENYYYYYFGSIGPFWLHDSCQGCHQWSSRMVRGDGIVMLYGNDPRFMPRLSPMVFRNGARRRHSDALW